MKSISREFMGATAVLFTLSILQREDSYGYEIVKKVKEISNDTIKWQVASIYPVLKKLENNGYIKSYWKTSNNERPRKYYTILEDGEKQLTKNVNEWNAFQQVFGVLWNPAT